MDNRLFYSEAEGASTVADIVAASGGTLLSLFRGSKVAGK